MCAEACTWGGRPATQLTDKEIADHLAAPDEEWTASSEGRRPTAEEVWWARLRLSVEQTRRALGLGVRA